LDPSRGLETHLVSILNMCICASLRAVDESAKTTVSAKDHRRWLD